MSKLPNVGTTIFTVMSKLANEHNAINLSQGFPNFPVDERLLEIVEKAAFESVHQYMPMPGYPELLHQISELINRSYDRKVIPGEELIVTAGATQAIFTAITALVDRGDDVVILDPSYDCYDPAIRLAGGSPVHIPLNESFLPDWEVINDAITDKTKMLIINNPHNPSGRIWSKADMTQLERLASKWENLIILSDEVYEYITFEQKHLSIHLYPSLFKKAISVSSFGKTFHITGWKIGYITAPKILMKEIKKVHQFNVFSVNSLAQYALSEYLKVKDPSDLGAFYHQKQQLFKSQMERSRFNLMPCDGTYFQTADYSEISNQSDVDFCRTLTIDYGVAAIPFSVFNEDLRDQKVIRFCFAKDDETILKATEKLCAI